MDEEPYKWKLSKVPKKKKEQTKVEFLEPARGDSVSSVPKSMYDSEYRKSRASPTKHSVIYNIKSSLFPNKKVISTSPNKKGNNISTSKKGNKTSPNKKGNKTSPTEKDTGPNPPTAGCAYCSKESIDCSAPESEWSSENLDYMSSIPNQKHTGKRPRANEVGYSSNKDNMKHHLISDSVASEQTIEPCE